MNERKVTIWLSTLTGALGVLIIGLIVGLAALSSDVAQVDEQVTALKFGAGAPGLPGVGGSLPPATRVPITVNAPTAFQAQIDDLRLTAKAVTVTLTVRGSGPADWLYLPPVVRAAQGPDYPVTAASLKAARLAWLDLTTAAQATVTFVFEPAPPAKGNLTLIFNPTMPVGDAVAPRVEVVLRAGE